MNRLLAKVSAFRQHALTGPVRVHVHNPARSERADRLVVYACLLAAGAGIAATQINSSTPSAQSGAAQSTKGVIIDMRAPQPIGPSSPIDERMLHDDSAPRLNYVQVSYGGRQTLTLDEASRIHLAKAAARQHNLAGVGLSWRDVYGVIHAETAWIARDGMGKNGVVSEGLAQLEPNTARGLGVQDPNDPVEAVHATAALMRQAAIWSRNKISGLDLEPKEKAEKLREGVSIFYNLSTKRRNTWDGTNTEDLPIETQHHIRNTQDGAHIAHSIDKRLARQAQQATAQARSSYTLASYGGKLSGGLAPTSTSLSIADQIKARVAANGFLQAAQSVQSILTNKCPLGGREQQTLDLNAACLASQPLVSQQASAQDLHRLFPNMTLLGDINGTPVLMADADFKDAVALGQVRQNGEVTGGIAISKGLVQALAGPRQTDHLHFVLGHELAHLAHKHEFHTDHAKVLEQEIEADLAGVEHMRRQAIPDDRIQASTSFLMDLLKEDRPPHVLPMTQARAAHLNDALMQRSERRNVFAQR